MSSARRLVTVIVMLVLLVELQGFAKGATLADLFNGGFIDAAGARFSDWQLIGLDSTAGQGPLLSQVTVNPIWNDPTRPGLQFAGNGQLATAGVNAIDMMFSYRVQSLPGENSFVNQSLGLTGISWGSGGGTAYLSQELAGLNGTDLGATVAFADKTSNVFQLASEAAFAPRFSFTVSTSVFLTGLAGGDTVNLSTFTQRFSQTGPLSLTGDFDGDGDVDGRDFLVWQRGGSPTPHSSTDLQAWQTNYGAGTPLAANVTAVPEPSTGLLVAAALASFAWVGRFG